MLNNEVTRAIAARRSVRKYAPRQLTAEELDTILTCGFLAPNGMNTQQWFVSVVQDPALLAELSEKLSAMMKANPGLPPAMKAKYDKPDFSATFGAPTLLMVASGNPRGVTDACLLGENMVLAAQSLGLGTCVIGSVCMIFDAPENAALKARLRLPEGYSLVFGISVGVPAEEPAAQPREPKYVIV